MSYQRLYKDMIRDTKMWNLYLGIDVDHIDVMAYCPLEDHSLFTATIPLETEVLDHSNALEEAIYDNPLLLNEFKRVAVINRNDRHALVPTDLATQDGDFVDNYVSEISGPVDGKSITVVDDLPLLGVSVCHSLPASEYNFLCRTFNGVKFVHRLSILTRYLHGTHRSTGSMTTFANLRRSSFDIVTYNSDKLLLSNTYRWNEPADVLYYIMACRRLWNIDRDTPVILSGDRSVRDEIMPMLRQYLPTVMPSVFPAAMFRAGGQTAMNTPIDLILMPLCE